MQSTKPRPCDSNELGLLGRDGAIDLAGGQVRSSRPESRSSRPPGDAWVADRDRRSLLPPTIPAAAVEPGGEEVEPPEDIHREIADRFALGDYGAALSAAELLLGANPEDHGARQYAETSRARLEARYTTRIGSLDYVFDLAVPAAKVKWLGLDPQAAFLLSLVDGQTTVADVVERCQMKRLEALRVFTELLEAKAIVRVA